MKRIKVNKIILEPFIDMLLEAYDSGVDYIDLIAQQGDDNQDALSIIVRPEYVDNERNEQCSDGLTSEKLNQLLNNLMN